MNIPFFCFYLLREKAFWVYRLQTEKARITASLSQKSNIMKTHIIIQVTGESGPFPRNTNDPVAKFDRLPVACHDFTIAEPCIFVVPSSTTTVTVVFTIAASVGNVPAPNR